MRKQFSILVWTWWVGLALSIPGMFVPVLGIIWIPAVIVAVVFWCFLHYRHWALLQGHGARTTPGKAVGFGFIPFYCFYWWFVSCAGLATDNNRHLREVGINSVRLSFPLEVTNCILGVLLCTIGLIPVVNGVLTVPYIIIGYILICQRKNCVLAILEHRTGKSPASQSATPATDAPLHSTFAKTLAKYAPTFLIALTVAAIWGYFFDLKNGQKEWFVGRLIVVPLIAVVVHRLFFRSSQVYSASSRAT